jgi:hypothetical protein
VSGAITLHRRYGHRMIAGACNNDFIPTGADGSTAIDD